ncbi:hypothetical protein ADIMK_4002 [Marinobacterium lacunae]|uniref:Uncharacterized protein n=1 Tax=Marinobacterium lacunae TaxID=1232683 RepID=A0A081FTK0_9GAMM|nr:hypothetical protein [Marinobacterium lacunae]KEA61855.1 hypothetical protein ADIMK_4002 [Marinobacterium lacunae]
MSRWTDQFNQRYALLHSLQEVIDSLTLDDETAIGPTQELERIRKAVRFLDGLMDTLDPELIPTSIWVNFSKQCDACKQQLAQYNANRNAQHIEQANNHADNLLAYIRPYMVSAGDAAIALREATTDAAEKISSRFLTLNNEVQQIKKSIQDSDENGKKLLSEISRIHGRACDFEGKVFGDENNLGTENRLQTLVDEAESLNQKISGYHEDIYVGSDDSPPIKQQIATAKEHVETEKQTITDLLSNVRKKTEALSEFYIKSFGDPDSDSEDKGLSGELEARKKELKDFAAEQNVQYKALNEQINSLLPGATSAGLAHAYHDMKKSFEQPIRSANWLFYGSIGGLVLISFLLSIDGIGGESIISFAHLTGWEALIQSFLYKLPAYAPILWLAFYASKRRSECHRLQQEYAHKEALAKSYHSYKQQIEALNATDPEMLQSLIKRSIDTIAYNAAETLDKRHGDKPPIQEVAEKAANSMIKKAAND